MYFLATSVLARLYFLPYRSSTIVLVAGIGCSSDFQSSMLQMAQSRQQVNASTGNYSSVILLIDLLHLTTTQLLD